MTLNSFFSNPFFSASFLLRNQLISNGNSLVDNCLLIANLSGAYFKTLVIRMLTELVEYGHKIEEKVKAMKSEIKENVQGTNSEGKKTGTQINSLDQTEEINIQPE